MISIEDIRHIIEKINTLKPQSIMLEPTISKEDIQQIEAKYKVSLPDEYILFITNIGDGGLFSSEIYGCNKLNSLGKYTDSGYSFENIEKPFLLKRSWIPDWGDSIEVHNPADEDMIEQLIEERWHMISNYGHIVLSESQTNNFMQWILIVNGPCWGEVWRISEFGIQRLINCNFLDWIKLCLEGHIEDFLTKCKKEEYPQDTDLKTRCKLYFKQSKIIMNAPASLSDVHNFEEVHGISLPEDYVYFITEIGNGSKKTPWYIRKIFSLMDNHRLETLNQPFFIQTEADYNQYFKDENNRRRIFSRKSKNTMWDFLDNPKHKEEPNSLWLLPQFQILKGCLLVMEKGNPANAKYPSYKQYFLILNGEYKGQIWSANEWGIRPTDNETINETPINMFTFIEAATFNIF